MSVYNTFWQEEWTKVWAYIQVGSGAIMYSLSILNEVITEPSLKAYITSLNPPQYAMAAMLILGAVTYVAASHRK